MHHYPHQSVKFHYQNWEVPNQIPGLTGHMLLGAGPVDVVFTDLAIRTTGFPPHLKLALRESLELAQPIQTVNLTLKTHPFGLNSIPSSWQKSDKIRSRNRNEQETHLHTDLQICNIAWFLCINWRKKIKPIKNNEQKFEPVNGIGIKMSNRTETFM